MFLCQAFGSVGCCCDRALTVGTSSCRKGTQPRSCRITLYRRPAPPYVTPAGPRLPRVPAPWCGGRCPRLCCSAAPCLWAGGLLVGLLCDPFGDFAALEAKADREVSRCVFGTSSVSVKRERPRSGKLESGPSCPCPVASGGRRGRERARSSGLLLRLLAQDPDPTGRGTLRRLSSR